jgi:hypothetical protein
MYLVVLAEGAGGGVLLLVVRAAGPAVVHNHLHHQEPFSFMITYLTLAV